MIVTSNRTRELHDALKRRCLYHWIDFPDLEREVADHPAARARGVRDAGALGRRGDRALRGLDLVKPPGVAEAIDWAQALALLGARSLNGQTDVAEQTLGWAVKNHDDLRRAHDELPALLRD